MVTAHVGFYSWVKVNKKSKSPVCIPYTTSTLKKTGNGDKVSGFETSLLLALAAFGRACALAI